MKFVKREREDNSPTEGQLREVHRLMAMRKTPLQEVYLRGE